MPQNPISETILDRLAAGASISQVKRELNLSKEDIITAALYGVAQLREEYIRLLLRRRFQR